MVQKMGSFMVMQKHTIEDQNESVRTLKLSVASWYTFFS